MISILEVLLLIGVFVYIFRFLFANYTSKVRKPVSWVRAVKEGKVYGELLKAERKYPDRMRFYTIWMQLERIKKDDITGHFAELGVYKGETARVLQLCAPERELHLFDTFEGFPPQDLVSESGKAAAYTSRHFADTSAGKILALLGNSNTVHIHQGYFPDTTKGLENLKFAFVSMDADLYKPTRAGLEYFYPRLSPGGIILLHDYNSDWPGLMQAVDEFCSGIPESPVLLPDADNTVAIVRNK